MSSPATRALIPAARRHSRTCTYISGALDACQHAERPTINLMSRSGASAGGGLRVPPDGLSFTRLSARQARTKSALRMIALRSCAPSMCSYVQTRFTISRSQGRRRQMYVATSCPGPSATTAPSATRVTRCKSPARYAPPTNPPMASNGIDASHAAPATARQRQRRPSYSMRRSRVAR